MPVRITREYPSTRISVETSKGAQFVRWAGDERNGENVPSGVRFSSVAPGGFETFNCQLPRSSKRSYPDLAPLSNIRVYGAGGESLWQGRLEQTPATSGDQSSISPSAVGYQAHLQDNENCSALFIDRDLSQWGDVPFTRKQALYVGGWTLTGSLNVNPGATSTMTLNFDQLDQDATPSTSRPFAIATTFYQAGPGNVIKRIRCDYFNKAMGSGWVWDLYGCPPDGNSVQGLATFITDAVDTLNYTSPHSMELFVPNSAAAVIQVYFSDAWPPSGGGPDTTAHEADMQNMRVFGTDIPIIGTGLNATEGIHASDALQYIINTFCPQLYADSTTIEPSTFVIPQLRFDGVTAGTMVNGCTAFGEPLPDWFVWEGTHGKLGTFYTHLRGESNRQWRARIGPSQLSDTGVDMSQMFNAVTVGYTDVSGAAQETAVITDPDPNNLVTAAGLTRLHRLDLGITSVDSVAVQVGKAYLAEVSQISRAGQASHMGYIEDANSGIAFSPARIRAGDTIEYTDSSDPTPRRVTHVDYDNDSRTATVSLDAPPDSMAGLLARLGVSISSVGVG